MNKRICILADIRYVLATGGDLEVYKVEGDGLPHADSQPVHSEKISEQIDSEHWRCNNCGGKFDGYEEIKKHLGRFHELVDPFNWAEQDTGPP